VVREYRSGVSRIFVSGRDGDLAALRDPWVGSGGEAHLKPSGFMIVIENLCNMSYNEGDERGDREEEEGKG